MRSVFFDTKNQEQFDRVGYVVLPLLSQEEIRVLLDAYEKPKLDPQYTRGFHATMLGTDVEAKKKADALIRSVIQPHTYSLLRDYKCLFGNFIVKEPEGDSFVGIHQDWTYLNEEQYRSINIWIPLTDTNEENGALHVLPGSQQLPPIIRYTPFEGDLYNQHQEFIFEHSIRLDLPAGMGVCYDSRLIHFSHPNRSGQPRMAIGTVNVPDQSVPLHYYRPNKNTCQLDVFEVDNAFFQSFSPGECPVGVHKVQTIEFKGNQLLRSSLEAVLIK